MACESELTSMKTKRKQGFQSDETLIHSTVRSRFPDRLRVNEIKETLINSVHPEPVEGSEVEGCNIKYTDFVESGVHGSTSLTTNGGINQHF